MSIERRIQKINILTKRDQVLYNYLYEIRVYSLSTTKDQSNIKMEVSMAEVVANTGVSKDKGYLYYLGKGRMYGVLKWLELGKVEEMQKK